MRRLRTRFTAGWQLRRLRQSLKTLLRLIRLAVSFSVSLYATKQDTEGCGPCASNSILQSFRSKARIFLFYLLSTSKQFVKCLENSNSLSEGGQAGGLETFHPKPGLHGKSHSALVWKLTCRATSPLPPLPGLFILEVSEPAQRAKMNNTQNQSLET